MPQASVATASDSVKLEGYEGHFEDFGPYTVGFERYTAARISRRSSLDSRTTTASARTWGMS